MPRFGDSRTLRVAVVNGGRRQRWYAAGAVQSGVTHPERSTVNQDLEHLIVLQAQDLDLAGLRAELAELPRRLKAAETGLAAAQAALADCQKQLGAEEKL